ncbi:MAG: thioredoxin domain-containing protein [Bacteroidia bacterium]|nr:thioredoxin domain-containing protein [Bacteroidia bacterium]
MPNQLIHESSPYLLQHANNPVDWHPWGEKALKKAKEENKLILVSIGYAACHWCHVMEHESFEDEQVAKIMNEHFVCIKVDREERPDIDKIYMDAVQLMTRQGGWPLNAFALPDGRPVYGGTYFRKDQWIDVLRQLAGLYQNDPQQVLSYADEMVTAMKSMVQVKPPMPGSFSLTLLEKVWETWKERIDFEWGGRKVEQNKFPVPANLRMLLRAGHFLQNEEMLEAARVSLRRMAFGGIYDQLGGGFARYSVDKYWKIPHFEKMLYDNGQLLSLYAEAYEQDPQDLYKEVVYRSLEFIERELMSEEGGFYSSLDADSEGVEGKFYVWSHQEVKEILEEDAQLFSDFYNVIPQGNWEETNVLFSLETEAEFARRWNLNPDSFSQKMAEGRAKLLEARAKRIRPGLDDKILCSWNALMLQGYLDAYRVFGEEAFLQTALKNARFIREKLTDGPQLYRNYKNGKRSINAFLDDYAMLIEAYISLYQQTFEEEWLEQAKVHMEYVEEHFHDSDSELYFYSSDEDPVLIHRKIETQDDVIPSSNAAIAHSLYNLGLLYHKMDYQDKARTMFATIKEDLMMYPAWFAHWGQLALKDLFPHFEVAITGEKALTFRKEIGKSYNPNRLFAGAVSESKLPILDQRFTDQSMIYICQQNSCQLPVSEVEAALEQMKA